MATLALAAVGAVAGSALLPTGISVLGLTLSGAALGSQIGAFAGSYIDNALFGTSGHGKPHEGPRLADLHVTASTEGAPIPRLYGRARLGAQVIWAADIREEIVTSSSGGGSAKGGVAPSQSGSQSIEYRYYATFAVALCEGEITSIGRVWVDSEELDLSRVTHRIYLGSETQAADSAIIAREGADAAPAYRGLAYIVFDDMPLLDYGNRIPQLSFEVFRSIEKSGSEIRGVVLIPGTGEFVYAPEAVTKLVRPGQSESENVHTKQGTSDWSVSLEQMDALLPNVASVSLVVSWFGDDLRAGVCQLKPGVEIAAKNTKPLTWSVAGLNRSQARLISMQDGRPAYGGTPSDQTVIAAIQDLKARGLAVTLTPFILMDVPEDNTRPDPYSASASQPAFPWRGRITVSPAPGVAGTHDKTAAAAAEVAGFVGTAGPGDFSIHDGAVIYSGPEEWTLRRMVLHQAFLAVAAGGVSAFVIGSEMRGLSQVRSGASSYPFVDALIALAADVKSVLGSATKVLYAADWSEYFGHQPSDGSGDVYFHLDPLWASTAIDAIGIDAYWPLADWRDGSAHLDHVAGATSIYDLDYLRSNVQGGEGYDWYYQSEAAREQQIRTQITDGAGKPWVFRYKDLKSWWLNAHYNRPGGVESAVATAWVPQSKPFWLMEIGCPAVDKGANQPNVFVDPKSSESSYPYFSRGSRDDLMQRQFLRALIEAFDPASSGYIEGLNPVSSVTGERMLDVDRIHVYAWDVRPYPAFPYNSETWSDGENWRLGHWLNGRLAAVSLEEAVVAVLDDYGFTDYDASRLTGTVPGFVIDHVMSPRDALQALELAYFFDSLESGGKIVFRHRGAAQPVLSLTSEDMVEERPGDALLTLTRAQETDLPASAKITFIAGSSDYRKAVAEARRLSGASGRVSQAEMPIVLDFERASEIAESWLFEAWASRERAAFKLPPSALAIEPGDVVTVERENETLLLRVTEVGDHGVREIEARAIDPEVYGGVISPARTGSETSGTTLGQSLLEFLDLPVLRGDEPAESGYVAAYQSPWPGGVAVHASPETTGYVLRALASAPAVIGETLDVLAGGPQSVLNEGARVTVELLDGQLTSVTRLQLLAGKNTAALRNSQGRWEVIQFEEAILVAPQTYELRRLLRGQAGTDGAIEAALPAGARFVLLGNEIARVSLSLDEIRLPLNWRYGPSSRDVGDTTYTEAAYTFSGQGLAPFSPVHVRGTRLGNGDLAITWIRRTRTAGDGWDVIEVPLGESAESYQVDILSGATVKRTLSVAVPSATYTAAQQAADFGVLQGSVSVVIYQLGSVFGRGTGKAAVV
ncbi:MAG: glycoside hydrolase/phage tail family protein [Hyphomicrobium sp.]